MKTMLYTFCAGLLAGALIIWYFFPRTKTEMRTETKIETEYKTKVVERWRTKPDGSQERERVEETSGNTTKAQTKVKKVNKKDWSVQISASTELKKLAPVYTLELDRYLVGLIFAGIYVNTSKEVGISLGLEF